jgi:hypothetical protein
MNHRLLRLSIVAAALLVQASRPAAAAAEQPDPAPGSTAGPIDRAAFALPGSDVRPLIRWWWPGGDVDDAELGRELALMHDAGFGGAEIQSFAVGLPTDAAAMVRTYGSPAWWSHVGVALDRAQALGLTIDLTLGSSWPSGGDDVPEDLSLQQLTMSQVVVQGPGVQDLVVPGPIEPLSYGLAESLLGIPRTFDPYKMRLVSVQAARLSDDQTPVGPPAHATVAGLPDLPPTLFLDPSSLVDLGSAVQPDGHIQWVAPPGTWVVFAFHTGPTGTKPFWGADPQGGLVLDHLSSEAVERHLDAIADRARTLFPDRYGSTLRSIFVDSLELRTELFWTGDFLAQFAARRGYHLESFLPILFRPFAADAYLSKVYPDAPPSFELRDVGRRIRYDYDQTVSELVRERFFAPLRTWSETNGLIARVQAHGGPGDLLTAYGEATIPETEGLFAGGRRSFLKLASSAAHLLGKPLVSSEILAFPRGSVTPTPEAILREANKHLAAGVNQFVLHGFPYVYDPGFDWPGWMPFDSPYMPGRDLIGSFGTRLNDRNLFWRFLPQVTDYLARADLVMRAGVPVPDLALYTGSAPYPDDPTADPDTNREIEKAGYAYDYVNGQTLVERASVVNGLLTIGDNHYRALVLPNVSRMPLDVATKIGSLGSAGLPIVLVGDIPAASEGLGADSMLGGGPQTRLRLPLPARPPRGRRSASGGPNRSLARAADTLVADADANDAAVAAIFETLFGATRDTVRAQDRYLAGPALYLAKAADLGDGLASNLGIPAEVSLGAGAGLVQYAHRRAGEADYYFLASSASDPLDATVTFPNPGGRLPEIWDLETGRIAPALAYQVEVGSTSMQLHFDAGGAVVVGFERPGASTHLETTDLPVALRGDDGLLTGYATHPGTYTVVFNGGIVRTVTVTGPSLPPIGLTTWDLVTLSESPTGERSTQSFQKVALRDLSSFAELKDFAGWAAYAAYVDLDQADPAYRSGAVSLFLDLGEVHDVAEVKVNDQPVGTLVKPPRQVDITPFVTAGLNKIEVVVTSSRGGSPAGLIGPVSVVPMYKVTLDGPKPLSASVVVTPAHFPQNSNEDMIAAIGRAAQITNHVNFQWFWKTPPSDAHPDGGDVVDCASVTPWVQEAHRLGLGVTLQFQTFYVMVEGSYGRALDGDAVPVVHVASPLMPFDTASYGNPELANAYLDQIGCLAALKPDQIVLGPEVNFIVAFRRDEWERFVPVYTKAYHLIKAISPATQVGLSYQYDGLRRDRLLNGDTWPFIAESGPQDFIGLTTYFGFSEQRNLEFPVPSTIPDDYYSPIREVLGNEVPIVFTEVGWSSYFESGLETQVLFLKRMNDLLAKARPAQIVWALLHDVNYFEGPGQSLNESGLLTRDDAPKPIWDEVLRFRLDGLLTDVTPQIFAPPPLPFSVTANPPNFPLEFTQEGGFEAIRTAAQVARSVSLQFSWWDRVTHQVWNCADIAPYLEEAQRQGLKVTLQFNTYAALPNPTPGGLPQVILLNPIDPPTYPVTDPDTQPSFADPAIRSAFLDQVGCLAAYKPESFVLGPEINFLYADRNDEFQQFQDVYRQAYAIIKAASPDTQVGTSFQFDALRENLAKGDDPSWMRDFGTQDFLGLTTYFGFSEANNRAYPNATDVPADYYQPIRAVFGPDVPVVFTEVGWSTFFANGPENQVLFLNRLPDLLRDVKPTNLVWALQHDVAGYFPGEIEPLNHLGLRQLDGTPKPGWDEVLQLESLGVYVSPR